MKHDYNYLGNIAGVVFSAIQSNEVLSIISWVLTLIATCVSIAFTLWKWWKKASADGKIDEQEIDELGTIVDDITKKGTNTDGKKD